MYKQKLQKKKKIWCILILFFLLFIAFFTMNRNYSSLEKIVRDIGVTIENFFLPTIDFKRLEFADGINRELEQENKELKELLQLDFSSYHIICANVISRDSNWYYELTIDKGERDGIKLDMAVTSNVGLIGRISKTGNTSSVVKLLTANSNDMKVSVTIQTKAEELHGIIDRYLEQENLIQVSNISKDKLVEIGDKVYTNGLGGIYPKGIYIGEVVEVSLDSLGLYQIAKIRTSSYENLRYVTVVDRR